jgi:hypothetical protein
MDNFKVDGRSLLKAIYHAMKNWDSPSRTPVRLVFLNDPCYKARAF